MSIAENEAVGTYRPTGDRTETPRPHSKGWDYAMDSALDDAKKKWGNGRFPSVRIRYEADIEITNPADVGEYRIILTR